MSNILAFLDLIVKRRNILGHIDPIGSHRIIMIFSLELSKLTYQYLGQIGDYNSEGVVMKFIRYLSSNLTLSVLH